MDRLPIQLSINFIIWFLPLDNSLVDYVLVNVFFTLFVKNASSIMSS